MSKYQSSDASAGKRMSFLLGTFLLTMLIFAAAKVVFMFCYSSEHAFSLADVGDVLVHGLSLDVSTSLYVLLLPLLLTIVMVWVRLPRGVLQFYFAFIAICMSLAFVADVSLYEFWHFKLDASCLGYLDTPGEAVASVTTGYLLIRLLCLVAAATILFLAYNLVASLGRGVGITLCGKVMETAGYLFLIPFIIIGVRGGLGESTTNIGQVYYSQDQFLNHAAVNPVFGFLSSIGKSGDYIVSYDYMDDDECRRLTNGIFSTESSHADTLLCTERPNIIIIIMESCGGQFTELGGHAEIMPNLNRLSREGVFFAECYANSWRTDKGVVSILSGYPSFPVTSVMKVPEKSRKLPSIAQTLSREGYACSFLYGGDINFTNMRSYVMSSGYSSLHWKADYSSEEQQSAQWGVRDDLMLNSLLEEIRNEKAGRWMKTLLTLSSHEPWDVPTRILDDKVYNAFRYLDHCIGQFVDSLQQMPSVWDNLLVVILPDHGYRYQGIDETTRLYNHIPQLWIGGAVRSPRRIERICNQSDLAATLFGQLGIGHDDFTFSRDVVGTACCQQAFHTYNNGFSVFDSLGFMAYDLDAEKMIAHEGNYADSLLLQGRAVLQLTSHDLIAK
jgi:phosphoglycerol transferase MdoB-like AlkP superfamily enzyme